MRLSFVMVVAALPLLLGAGDPEPEPIPPAIEAKLLLGPFEGHGIKPPKDKKKAARARALAQRLTHTCFTIHAREGGGSHITYHKCKTRKATKDDIAAILDALNDVRVSGTGMYTNPETHKLNHSGFHEALRTVAEMGRTDVAAPLVTALERLALRIQYADYLTVKYLDDKGRFEGVRKALTLLTYHRVESQGSKSKLSPAEVAKRWRQWFDEHGDETRKAWRKRRPKKKKKK